MGALEFEDTLDLNSRSCNCSSGCGCNGDEKGEACIIAQKIFDQCRVQKCLTGNILGPARVADCQVGHCDDMLCDSDIIVPPANAASVNLRDTELSRIDILRKTPNGLQEGCWDIELRYVFSYTLEFRRADGCSIGCTNGTSSYHLKVTLYGSTESDVTTSTDLYDCCSNSHGGPFVIAEGKAVGLTAELCYPHWNDGCGCDCNCDCSCDCNCNHGCNQKPDCNGYPNHTPIAVYVTLGLFTIIKMFRTINMLVESHGRCVPAECTKPASSGDPCRNFDRMAFPLDLFSPSSEPRSCCTAANGYSSSNCHHKEESNYCCEDNCSSDHKKHDSDSDCHPPRNCSPHYGR